MAAPEPQRETEPPAEAKLPPGGLWTKLTESTTESPGHLAEQLLLSLRSRNGPQAPTLHDEFMLNQLLARLGLEIEQQVDVETNRFSRRFLHDLFHTYFAGPGTRESTIEGSTYLELGCGSMNPLSLLTVFVLLGAKRAIGVDLDPVHDVSIAARALARTASYLLTDPRLIVGDYPITREQVAHNVRSLDLLKLCQGDPSGLDESLLAFRNESVYELSLDDDSVDGVFSNSFLEHIEDLDRAIEEIARVTRKHGIGCHNIDGEDHGSHTDPDQHPLAFLTVEPERGLVRGCNRLRPLSYLPIFESHGFEILDTQIWGRQPVDDTLRAKFVEPFRSMPLDRLEVSGLIIRIRKL
ncbi:MAG: hypothetical protein CMJ85_09350 [Planctomycetes bacterium]|nr:hypothetical protein [Planctomycetota bacterium]